MMMGLLSLAECAKYSCECKLHPTKVYFSIVQEIFFLRSELFTFCHEPTLP